MNFRIFTLSLRSPLARAAQRQHGKWFREERSPTLRWGQAKWRFQNKVHHHLAAGNRCCRVSPPNPVIKKSDWKITNPTYMNCYTWLI